MITAAVSGPSAMWYLTRGTGIEALILPSGPLAAGWAQRAGTPSSLLRSAVAAASTGSANAGGSGTRTSFGASVSGTDITAVVSDSTGAQLRLLARLQIDPRSGTASGVLTSQPREGA
jgi:hypothetical protein